MISYRLDGIKSIKFNLENQIKGIQRRSEAGALKAALMLQAASMKEVPVDTGFLRSTCHVERVGIKNPMYRVGYSAIYALATHENPRSGKTNGISPSGWHYKTWAKVGKWKFLQHPMERMYKELYYTIYRMSRVRQFTKWPRRGR